MLRYSSIALLVLASMNAIAHAQGEPAAAPTPGAPMVTSAPAAVAPAPAPMPAPSTGPSFRNGFSLSVSDAIGSGPSSGLSEQLYGVDWRIGARVTDQLAVYADTHLSFGTAKFGGASGVTGNFAAALIGEYTLPLGVFVGGGGGYGVLNNPSGPLGQLRVGWYPMKASEGVSRRLNIALDARWYFADAMTIGTVTQVALSLGYDRF
jgi:hypothetical protein